MNQHPYTVSLRKSNHVVCSVRLEKSILEKIEEAIELQQQKFPFNCNKTVYIRGAILNQLKQDGIL